MVVVGGGERRRREEHQDRLNKPYINRPCCPCFLFVCAFMCTYIYINEDVYRYTRTGTNI